MHAASPAAQHTQPQLATVSHAEHVHTRQQDLAVIQLVIVRQHAIESIDAERVAHIVVHSDRVESVVVRGAIE